MKTNLRELTDFFSVLDLFGGSPNPNDDYATALKKAETRGATFSAELWQQTLQVCGEEGIDLSYCE